MSKHNKAFLILENVKPNAKYTFKDGNVISNVSEKDINFLSDDGSTLRECGWTIYNGFWSIVY